MLTNYNSVTQTNIIELLNMKNIDFENGNLPYYLAPTRFLPKDNKKGPSITVRK